jgi:hypothetical protein
MQKKSVLGQEKVSWRSFRPDMSFLYSKKSIQTKTSKLVSPFSHQRHLLVQREHFSDNEHVG